MLSRVAAKPRLCWACRQHLQLRPSALRCAAAIRPLQLRRLYSSERSEPSEPGSTIRNALKALIIDTEVPIEEIKPRKGGGEVDDFSRRIKEQRRTGLERVAERGVSEHTAEDGTVLPVLDAPEESEVGAETDGSVAADDLASDAPFKHDLLHHQKLEIDALGQSIEALIIKNPNRVKRPRKPLRALDEQAIERNLGWDGLIQKKDSESDFSEVVWRNLEELRPKKSIVPLEEFARVMSTIVDGFTKDQLFHFYNYESNSEPALEDSHDRPWLVRQSEWAADTPHVWGRLTPKQALALTIMTKRWGVEVKEHVESLGRMQIWLRPSVFRLLTRAQSKILERLGLEVLDRSAGETITANAKEARLTIYTQKIAVPIFLAQLTENLQNLRRRRVSVDHIGPQLLEQTVLAELGRITNTHIEHDARTKELDIQWIDQNDIDSNVSEGHMQTEDSADVVLRLLLAVEPKQSQPTTAEVLAPVKRISTPPNSFTKYDRETKSMSWKDKLGSWSRYAYHIGQPTGGKRKGLALHERLTLPTPTFGLAEAGTENRLTATFGYILHGTEDASRITDAASHRILAPVVPHPAAFTSVTKETDKQVAQSTAIILNFSPASSSAENGSSIGPPEIRLRLPINPDTDLANFSFLPNSALYGTVPWHTHDVMLPSECVDVRISQQRILALDTEQQDLKTFLASSEFNLLAGRLRTPSHTRFTIPARWLSMESSGVPDQTVDVPYVFTGLEVHQSVDLEWEGHVLRYNSIEAGHHGGQRQEVSLQAAIEKQDEGVSREKQTKTFLKLIQDVAKGKMFSWNDGYKLALERSQEDFEIELVDEDADMDEGADVLEKAENEDDSLVPDQVMPVEGIEAEYAAPDVGTGHDLLEASDAESASPVIGTLDPNEHEALGDTTQSTSLGDEATSSEVTVDTTRDTEKLLQEGRATASDSVSEATPIHETSQKVDASEPEDSYKPHIAPAEEQAEKRAKGEDK